VPPDAKLPEPEQSFGGANHKPHALAQVNIFKQAIGPKRTSREQEPSQTVVPRTRLKQVHRWVKQAELPLANAHGSLFSV
jgi:hypothetical protein